MNLFQVRDQSLNGVKLNLAGDVLDQRGHVLVVPISSGLDAEQRFLETKDRLHCHGHGVPASLHRLDDLDVVDVVGLTGTTDDGADFA